MKHLLSKLFNLYFPWERKPEPIPEYNSENDLFVIAMQEKVKRAELQAKIHKVQAEVEAQNRLARGNPIADAAFPPRRRPVL